MAPPAAFRRRVVSAAFSTLTSQPIYRAPSDANNKAAARPILPPLPVMMQTFPERRPAICVTPVQISDAP
jgi:hypothetical protein